MPISDAPIRAAGDLLSLDEQLRAFLTVARVKAADGITLAELAELLLAAARLGIAAVDSLAVATGEQKKAIVISAVGVAFDALAGFVVVPLPLAPLWYLARPAIRSLTLVLAAGAIETLLPLVRVAG